MRIGGMEIKEYLGIKKYLRTPIGLNLEIP